MFTLSLQYCFSCPFAYYNVDRSAKFLNNMGCPTLQPPNVSNTLLIQDALIQGMLCCGIPPNEILHTTLIVHNLQTRDNTTSNFKLIFHYECPLFLTLTCPPPRHRQTATKWVISSQFCTSFQFFFFFMVDFPTPKSIENDSSYFVLVIT